MQENNNINKKNNIINDYKLIEKFILGEPRYIAAKIIELAAPFAGGFVHASLPDYPNSYISYALFGTFMGVGPTFAKYLSNSMVSQCKEVFKKDINTIDNAVFRNFFKLRLENLDYNEKEKTLNQMEKFVKSDKKELSDYLNREVNKSAFKGAISYAVGFCFKKMFF